MKSCELLRRVARPYQAAIAGIGAELHQHGWAEAHAGNFSIRLGDTPRFSGGPIRLFRPFPGLANQGILLKRAGARMRDVARRPISSLCLLRIGSDGRTGRVVPAGAVPTSELPTHLACHELLVRHRPEQKALVHTHPTELIALTNTLPSPGRLLELLADGHVESSSVMGRVAVTKRLKPGTTRLAQATARVLLRHDAVIWPGHGVIASGPDLSSALDLIEILNKLAAILLLSHRI